MSKYLLYAYVYSNTALNLDSVLFSLIFNNVSILATVTELCYNTSTIYNSLT